MINTWSEGDPAENMPEEILVDLGAVIGRHPWWRSRAGLTVALLERLGVRPPARVLDAGCGWGVTLECLEKCGYQVVGADISLRALERLDGPGRQLAQADLTQPFAQRVEPFAAVLALDVIEHLDDDQCAIRNLAGLLAPGGVLIISVPALPELFTEFDEIQGHRRRYLPETLRAAFADTGVVVENLFWWGAWMVPILKRQRKPRTPQPGRTASEIYREYLRLPPWPLPWLLRLAFLLEQRRALKGRLSVGTSLFAVARRPAESR